MRTIRKNFNVFIFPIPNFNEVLTKILPSLDNNNLILVHIEMARGCEIFQRAIKLKCSNLEYKAIPISFTMVIVRGFVPMFTRIIIISIG